MTTASSGWRHRTFPMVRDGGIIIDGAGAFAFLRYKHPASERRFRFDRIVNPNDGRRPAWTDRCYIPEDTVYLTELGVSVVVSETEAGVQLTVRRKKSAQVWELTDWYRRLLDGREEMIYEEPDSVDTTFDPNGAIGQVARTRGQSLIVGYHAQPIALVSVASLEGDAVNLEIHRRDGSTELATVRHGRRFRGTDMQFGLHLDDHDVIWFDFQKPLLTQDLEVYTSRLILEQFSD